MKTIIPLLIDGLLWVSASAFAASLISHLLRVAHYSFIAGIILASYLLVAGLGTHLRPDLRPLIATRTFLVLIGMALGVLA